MCYAPPAWLPCKNLALTVGRWRVKNPIPYQCPSQVDGHSLGLPVNPRPYGLNSTVLDYIPATSCAMFARMLRGVELFKTQTLSLRPTIGPPIVARGPCSASPIPGSPQR